MRTVLVFKTSVEKKKEVIKLRPFLDQLINSSGRWNFDLEDCDNILRVETPAISSGLVISTLEDKGYLCEEL